MLSHFSHFRLFVTPWSVARQASLSMGFSRQEYWSRLPCPPARDLPDPGIKPASLASPALAGRFFTTEPPGKPSLGYLLSVLLPEKLLSLSHFLLLSLFPAVEYFLLLNIY